MQQLNPSEISEIIKGRIDNLNVSSEAQNEGTIVSVSDGIIRIHGLADVMYGEMIEFDGGVYGMALNLERDSVGAVVLGDYQSLAEGQKARCTGRVLEVPVGPELEGRVVDALGNPIDGKGPINAATTDAIEKVAPGVIARKSVDQPVQIGLKAVDSMVPIGRGQRELIIGDDVYFGGKSLVGPITAEAQSLALMGSVVTHDMKQNRVYAGVPAVDITDKVGVHYKAVSVDELSVQVSVVLIVALLLTAVSALGAIAKTPLPTE